jgi:hypothetical protein
VSEEEFSRLEYVALTFLEGYLSSGRKEASIDGYLYSVEEAAIKTAQRFIKKLKEVQDGQD